MGKIIFQRKTGILNQENFREQKIPTRMVYLMNMKRPTVMFMTSQNQIPMMTDTGTANAIKINSCISQIFMENLIGLIIGDGVIKKKKMSI